MDASEVEENLFAASNAKLHGGMYRDLSVVVCKLLRIFPALEAARPRSKSGIQALCSLHVAVEKAKGLLQHCSNCSKLYLAITSDSVLIKFEKAKCALEESLRRVEDIVPQAIGCQILEIASELERITFALDPSEKQVGDEVIALLQQERKFSSSSNDYSELEIFRQVVLKLHITSPRAALIERRALKRLIERARAEDDKRKESIIAYLLHLLRKYSKLFRSEFSDDNDSQGSTPCSPTVQGSFEDCSGPIGNGHAFQRQLSKLSSFNFRTNSPRSGNLPMPPEELRCPISLKLMYDPVIISSGQTYERACIEKWLSDGHTTCPKTQQQLSHVGLTPNYCVKDLITRWCEHNEIPVPDGPPGSLDLNYWRLALSESEGSTRSTESTESCKFKGVMVVSPEKSETTEILEENDVENLDSSGQEAHDKEVYMFERCQSFMAVLNEGENLRTQLKVVEQIRLSLKDDEETRDFMGANGFVEALVRFLRLAVHEGNENAEGIGAMALFNLAVDNDRNKGMMLSQGVIKLLEEMILKSKTYESATALFLNLSCLDKAKPIIGSGCAVPFLVQFLQADSNRQCKLDALHTLYNISTLRSNTPRLISAGIIGSLQALLTGTTGLTTEHMWAEKSIAILANLALSKSGKKEIVSAPGLISGLAAKLEGEPGEQEQAASCLLLLCNEDKKCSQMVLKEGVIPSLVTASVNGTTRGKEKARKLLILFRDQRQEDPSHVQVVQQVESSTGVPEIKPTCKLSSNKPGRTWGSLWRKSKGYSVYQC